jgi:hypothetical protein
MIDQDPVPVVHNGGRRLSFLEAHSCCSPPVRGIVRPERLRYREHMSETEFNNPPAPESESALESESARESEPTPEIDSMSSPTPTKLLILAGAYRRHRVGLSRGHLRHRPPDQCDG